MCSCEFSMNGWFLHYHFYLWSSYSYAKVPNMHSLTDVAPLNIQHESSVECGGEYYCISTANKSGGNESLSKHFFSLIHYSLGKRD